MGRVEQRKDESPDRELQELFAHWFPGCALVDVPQSYFLALPLAIYFGTKFADMENHFITSRLLLEGFLWRMNLQYANKLVIESLLFSVEEFSYRGDLARKFLTFCRAYSALQERETFGGVLQHRVSHRFTPGSYELYSAGILRDKKPQAVAFFHPGPRRRKEVEEEEKVILSELLPVPSI